MIEKELTEVIRKADEVILRVRTVIRLAQPDHGVNVVPGYWVPEEAMNLLVLALEELDG